MSVKALSNTNGLESLTDNIYVVIGYIEREKTGEKLLRLEETAKEQQTPLPGIPAAPFKNVQPVDEARRLSHQRAY